MDLIFKTNGYYIQTEDLQTLLSEIEQWGQRMYPEEPFDSLISQLEDVSEHPAVQVLFWVCTFSTWECIRVMLLSTKQCFSLIVFTSNTSIRPVHRVYIRTSCPHVINLDHVAVKTRVSRGLVRGYLQNPGFWSILDL